MSHVARMSHGTRVDEACHTCGDEKRHTYGDEACHMYEWGMSHVGMRHATHMNESCHVPVRYLLACGMSRVTRTNNSGHTHGPILSRILMSHGAHVWMKQVTRTSEACEWVMSHI